MKHKYLRIKQLKIAIQMDRASKRKYAECGLVYGYNNYNSVAMHKKEFFAVAKALHINPIINNNYSSDYKYHAHFILEGREIYSIYNDTQEFKYDSYQDLERKYKELYFECNDRQTAFEKLKQIELEKINDKYKTKRPLYWIKNYSDFEKYLDRHKTKFESNASRYNKYLEYKNNFKPLDDDVSYDEAERIRPNNDWYIPLSLKQWIKVNF